MCVLESIFEFVSHLGPLCLSQCPRRLESLDTAPTFDQVQRLVLVRHKLQCLDSVPRLALPLSAIMKMSSRYLK